MIKELFKEMNLMSVVGEKREVEDGPLIVLGHPIEKEAWASFMMNVMDLGENKACQFSKMYYLINRKLGTVWRLQISNTSLFVEIARKALAPEWLKNYKAEITKNGIRVGLVGDALNTPDPRKELGMGQGR